MSEQRLVNWYRKECLPASGVMEMPNEVSEIIHIVKLCRERDFHSWLYNMAFYPLICSLSLSAISEFQIDGWAIWEIGLILFAIFYTILATVSVVSDGFEWFRSRTSFKKITTQTLSSEEMTTEIQEFSKHNKEISKKFSFGKTFKVYCLEKADAI